MQHQKKKHRDSEEEDGEPARKRKKMQESSEEKEEPEPKRKKQREDREVEKEDRENGGSVGGSGRRKKMEGGYVRVEGGAQKELQEEDGGSVKGEEGERVGRKEEVEEN